MIQTALRPEARTNYVRGGAEMLIDFRRQLELDEEARVERRRIDIAEQTLEPNAPGRTHPRMGEGSRTADAFESRTPRPSI